MYAGSGRKSLGEISHGDETHPMVNVTVNLGEHLENQLGVPNVRRLSVNRTLQTGKALCRERPIAIPEEPSEEGFSKEGKTTSQIISHLMEKVTAEEN